MCPEALQAFSVELRTSHEELFHKFQILDGVTRPEIEHFGAYGFVHRLTVRKHPLWNTNDLFSPIAFVPFAHGVTCLLEAID